MSDYKQATRAHDFSQRTVPLDLREEKTLIKLKTQNILHEENSDSLGRAHPLRSPALSNRRLLSNDGKSSSNSHRLNQDILSAKIDSNSDSNFRSVRIPG